jgi:TetR/AcrR family transcriptional regulator, cholesterol catabolism regulator
MTAQRQPASSVNSRRAEICRTAARIFRDRGFNATSVSDIARALGMTKAGLYHYFVSKEALLFEIISFGLDRVHDEVIAPARALRDPEARIREVVVRHARIVTRAHGAVAGLGDETRALPAKSRRIVERRMRGYFEFVRDTLSELNAAGRLRRVDPTVAAFSVLGTILWIPHWFRHEGRLTEEQVADEVANIVLGGLLQPPVRARRAPRPRRTPS